MSVEKRTTVGRTVYLARWRRDGRQVARTFDRKSDAVAFERERRREASLGAHGLPEPSPRPLEDWLAEWFRSNRAGWKANTRTSYANVIDKWLIPYIGGVRLRDLGHARVRRWRDEALADGCSAVQANKASRVLSSALGAAVREGLLPANPVVGLRRLPVGPKRPRALAPAEAELIRAHLHELRDVVFWGLLAYAGLRPGEARALRWRDVRDHVLVVDRAVSGREIGPTKTYARRTVELVAPLAADLDLLRPKVAAPDALVVAAERGGLLDLDNWRRRVWGPACEAAGVRATPYEGRQTYASLLIHEGRSLPYVTAALGHSSAVTTLAHYAHLLDAARHATAAPMVESVLAARAALERRGVYPACTRRPVRVLRSPARTA